MGSLPSDPDNERITFKDFLSVKFDIKNNSSFIRGYDPYWDKLKTVNELTRGDIVRSKKGFNTYIVCGAYGDRATAVKSVDITNPDEWEILKKSKI